MKHHTCARRIPFGASSNRDAIARHSANCWRCFTTLPLGRLDRLRDPHTFRRDADPSRRLRRRPPHRGELPAPPRRSRPPRARTRVRPRASTSLDDMRVTLVHVSAKPGTEEAFVAASLANATNSVEEPDNCRFDCLQDLDDPSRFVLVEIYRTPAGPAAHKETSHYLTWRDEVADMMARTAQPRKVRPDLPLAEPLGHHRRLTTKPGPGPRGGRPRATFPHPRRRRRPSRRRRRVRPRRARRRARRHESDHPRARAV